MERGAPAPLSEPLLPRADPEGSGISSDARSKLKFPCLLSLPLPSQQLPKTMNTPHSSAPSPTSTCGTPKSPSAAKTPRLSSHGTVCVRRQWKEQGARLISLPGKLRAYWSDAFHSAVELPWYKLIFLVVAMHVISWLVYGALGVTVWGRTCLYHGNNTDIHLNWVFWACETMSTVGYGYLRPTCTGTKLMVCVMVLHALFMDTIAFGLVFAKFSRPSLRARTILVSESLCGKLLHEEDGSNAIGISLRLVNLRQRPASSPQAELYLVDHRPQENGEPPCFTKLDFTQSIPLAFLEFPCVLTALIKPDSPVYRAARSAVAFADAEANACCFQESGLEDFSLVLIFNARDSVSGVEFEVRKWWPLASTSWECEFKPMIEASCVDHRASHSALGKPSPPQQAEDFPQRKPQFQRAGTQILDMSCINNVVTIETPCNA